jgi:hypothetical protein
MVVRKFINSFLILVLVLQLLPVKQAVEYFFIKNQVVEELLDVNKSTEKNQRFFDEDHKSLPLIDYLLPQFIMAGDSPAFHYKEILPAFHSADIHTPPPNKG